jgi:S-(hydroxymethyl)glutathione dehydrogenase / alcohol dehydrogenase
MLPKTMKAAILVEQRQPLVIDEVELPRQLEVGQVLVKVHHTGICGSQLGEIAGVKGPDAYLPHLMGHEASGTVKAVGPGVKHVKPDDVVVLHWRKGAGIQADPPAYTWNGKRVNAGWITTFNEYAIVSENRCTAIPSDCDLEVAALFGCAVTTGFGVVENDAQVRIGEAVVVFGAGGIGLNIVQAASMVSAYPIIAVDLLNSRLELAEQLGATHTINSNEESAEERIQEILGGNLVDVFIDNTGSPKIIEMGYLLTKGTGRVILVGVPQKGKNISIYSLPLHFGKRMTGSQGGQCQPEEDIPRYLKLYQQKRIQLNGLISKRYSLEQINEAMDAMRDGSLAGRCLVNL